MAVSLLTSQWAACCMSALCSGMVGDAQQLLQAGRRIAVMGLGVGKRVLKHKYFILGLNFLGQIIARIRVR